MSMDLWEMSGGLPHWTSGTLTVGAGTVDTTILSVAATKRAIPVWFWLWGFSADSDRITNFVLRGVDALDSNRSAVLIDNLKIFALVMQPVFINFGIHERNSLAAGEDIKVALSSSDSTTASDGYGYALGYYLVDA
jgi:hypothetical protein